MPRVITLHLLSEDVKLMLSVLEAIEVRTEEQEELRRFLEYSLIWNHAK